jgi:hypothetical protein
MSTPLKEGVVALTAPAMTSFLCCGIAAVSCIGVSTVSISIQRDKSQSARAMQQMAVSNERALGPSAVLASLVDWTFRIP